MILAVMHVYNTLLAVFNSLFKIL